MTIDDKLTSDKDKNINDILREEAETHPESYNALKKLIVRMDDENKHFVKRFAKEEFNDLDTRKKFIYDEVFREQYFNTQFEITAGDEVYKECLKFFDDYTSARQWYFSKLPVLEYKRPYDYCKRKDTETIVQLLGRLEWGILS